MQLQDGPGEPRPSVGGIGVTGRAGNGLAAPRAHPMKIRIRPFVCRATLPVAGLWLVACSATSSRKFEPRSSVAEPALASAGLSTPMVRELLQAPTEPYRLGPGDKLESKIPGEGKSRAETFVTPDDKLYYNMVPGHGENSARGYAREAVDIRSSSGRSGKPSAGACATVSSSWCTASPRFLQPPRVGCPSRWRRMACPSCSARSTGACRGPPASRMCVDMLLEAAVPAAKTDRLGIAAVTRLDGWEEHSGLQARLRQADLMVFPSIREFGGGAVLEAMALGVPPVVLNHGGPPELVPPDCGFVLPLEGRPQVVRDLGGLLARLVADHAALPVMGRAAPAHVLRHFTWQAKARQITQVYQSVLGLNRDKPDWGTPLGFPPHAAAARKLARQAGEYTLPARLLAHPAEGFHMAGTPQRDPMWPGGSWMIRSSR